MLTEKLPFKRFGMNAAYYDINRSILVISNIVNSIYFIKSRNFNEILFFGGKE